MDVEHLDEVLFLLRELRDHSRHLRPPQGLGASVTPLAIQEDIPLPLRRDYHRNEYPVKRYGLCQPLEFILRKMKAGVGRVGIDLRDVNVPEGPHFNGRFAFSQHTASPLLPSGDSLTTLPSSSACGRE